MELKDLQRHWDEFSRKDAMYAINTRPGKENGQWDRCAFYQTGEREILRVQRYLGNKGYSLGGQKALDFGCGIGRLSVALGPHFDEVIGVDISPSMIAQARVEHNSKSNLSFVLNEVDNLAVFEEASFDFIYSNITLQHMAPKYAKRYIHEFVRLLKPDGLCLFQLPSRSRLDRENKSLFQKVSKFLGIPPSLHRRILLLSNRLKWSILRRPIMEMYGIPSQEVIACIESCGGKVLHVKENRHAGQYWESFYYLIGKGVI